MTADTRDSLWLNKFCSPSQKQSRGSLQQDRTGRVYPHA